MSRERRERQRAYLGQKYVAEAIAKGARIPRGRVGIVTVAHDDWCALLAGRGPCNCNPTVADPKILPAPEDN